MSHFNENYGRAAEAASRGEGTAMTDEDLCRHMTKNYAQFSEFRSQQDVIRMAVSGGYALRHLDGRLFLMPAE